MLKKEQCSLTIAENGFEAIKLFEENEFDLILMDVKCRKWMVLKRQKE